MLVAARSEPSQRDEGQRSRRRPTSREERIVQAALHLAKKLSDTHEAELARTRRSALLAWSATAALLAGCAAATWWGWQKASQLDRARLEANLAGQALEDARNQYRQAEARAARLTRRLDTSLGDERSLRLDKDRLQSDLMTARDALARSQARLEVLTAELERAKTRTAELDAALESARAKAEQLQQRLRRAEPVPGPQTRPAELGAGW